MEFGLGHGALKAEQQAIIMRSGIIDGFFIDDQGLAEGTDFQQARPIAARTGQTRDLQAQDRSNMSQADFCHEPLKPITANDRGSRLPLILIHDLDLRTRPPQILSSLHQILLPKRTAAIFAHLEQGRLSDVNDGETIKMVRTDFLRCLSVEHRPPPFPYRDLQDEQQPCLLLTELASQQYEFAHQKRGQATPALGSPACQQQIGARTYAHLLVGQRSDAIHLWLSYRIPPCKWLSLAHVLKELGDFPQAFNREQRRFGGAGISLGSAGVIRQAGGNRPMITV